MILVGGFGSPFTRRVAVTMRLLNLDFEHQPLRSNIPEQRAELQKINPLVRIPALVTDDAGTLVDSATILDYLDHKVGPEKSLTPLSGPERIRVMALIGLAVGAVEKSIAEYYERGKRPSEKYHQPWMDQLLEQSKDGFVALDQEAQSPWMTGNSITQADISTISFWDFAKHNRPDDAPPLDCPKLAALSERASAMPEFSETRPPDY